MERMGSAARSGFSHGAREPNLNDVVDFLGSEDPVLVANAASYLQHLAYGDDSMKAKIRLAQKSLMVCVSCVIYSGLTIPCTVVSESVSSFSAPIFQFEGEVVPIETKTSEFASWALEHNSTQNVGLHTAGCTRTNQVP